MLRIGYVQCSSVLSMLAGYSNMQGMLCSSMESTSASFRFFYPSLLDNFLSMLLIHPPFLADHRMCCIYPAVNYENLHPVVFSYFLSLELISLIIPYYCQSVRSSTFKVVLQRFTALMFTSLYLPMTLGFNCDAYGLSNCVVNADF